MTSPVAARRVAGSRAEDLRHGGKESHQAYTGNPGSEKRMGRMVCLLGLPLSELHDLTGIAPAALD